jgi:hypothetical protein
MCFCAFPNITLYLIIYIYRKPPATSLAPSHPRTLAPLDGIIQPPASHPRTPGWYHPATRLAPSHPWVVSSSHPPRTLAPLGGIIQPPASHPRTPGTCEGIFHTPPDTAEPGEHPQGGGASPCETTISGLPPQTYCSKYQLFIFSYWE